MKIFIAVALFAIAAGARSSTAAAAKAKRAPGGASLHKSETPLYKNPHASIDDRVDDLLKRMTLEEKQQQTMQGGIQFWLNSDNTINQTALELNGAAQSGTVWAGQDIPPEALAAAIYATQSFLVHKTRLGIPGIMQSEGIHGYIIQNSTLFTSPIGFACSFNPELVKQIGDVVGSEAESVGINQIFAPVLDLSRELRWGRVEENYGEDPFLTGEIGKAFVQGLQTGKRPGTAKTAVARLSSMVKHFAAFGSPLGGLNIGPVAGGERDLRTVYLPPFKKAIIEGGALAVMTAYSSYDGIPAAANHHLLVDILRNEWGFKGFAESDSGSIEMLCSTHNICAPTATPSAAPAIAALDAGNDMEMGGSTMHFTTIAQSVAKGLISEATLDESVRRVLYVKFALGLFENPWPANTYKEVIHKKSSVELSYKVETESIVLLENDGTLPLSKNLESLAVIGPQAAVMQYGDYVLHGAFSRGITPLQGLRDLAGKKTTINYAEGCKLWSNDESGFAEAVKAAKNSKVAVVMVGTWSRDQTELWEGLNATTGEHVDVNDLALVGAQLKLVQAIKATGTPTVVIFISGKPVAEPWIKANANAVVQAFYPGEQSGRALADTLFGNVNPSGKLSVSFPTYIGSTPGYYNYLKAGRPLDPGSIGPNGQLNFGHQYVLGTPVPLWSFGHGLSYTNFTYSNLKLSKTNVTASDKTIHVSVQVTNAGKVTGQEVVQVYVTDLVSSVVTPVRELKGFKKVAIPAGKTVTVTIPLTISDLAVWTLRSKFVVESGEFSVQVGGGSDIAKLVESFWYEA